MHWEMGSIDHFAANSISLDMGEGNLPALNAFSKLDVMRSLSLFLSELVPNIVWTSAFSED
jgi:hypothetical protein